VVTGKTAEAHVARILNKLGLTNRVQIATWGMRRGLVSAAAGDLVVIDSSASRGRAGTYASQTS
jgi:hypothetical protein